MPFQPRWTRETILEAVHTWVRAHHGRFLQQADLDPRQGLPNKGVVQRHIGTMPALKAAYEARYGSRAGLVQCPRCGGEWWSPDRVEQRTHPVRARAQGQCRMPGQGRFGRRRRRHRVPQEHPVPPSGPDPSQALARDLLTEALWRLAEPQAMAQLMATLRCGEARRRRGHGGR